MSVSYFRSRMKAYEGERMSSGQGIKNDSLAQDPWKRVCFMLKTMGCPWRVLG